ncbi:MAG: phosphoribulokinase [Carbonactinosporaceae bacterium]
MPDKLVRIHRAQAQDRRGERPAMLGIAGDSAAGKTTLTRGLVAALGEGRSTSVCVDDYHRFDRRERRDLPFTPLHPDCNYVAIMEQHLELLAAGQPVLKPVYDHAEGTLVRPVLVEPRDFVIAEGLLPLHTRLARACFDVTVFLAPPERLRRRWKVQRDTTRRGYTEEQVLAELERREPESQRYIRSQRGNADIVVSVGELEEAADPPVGLLSTTLLLRSTIHQPNLAEILAAVPTPAARIDLMRDVDGRPVEALHLPGDATAEECTIVAKAIWDTLDVDDPLPESLGVLDGGVRSEPLRLTQLMMLYHLVKAARPRLP